jgi:branched-chain amino acid transport system substrate-binding protein
MTYQYVPVITKAMTAWERAKSVAIVYDESALYTQGIASAVKSGLEASGVRVAAFQAIQPGRSSYASVIRALSRTKPDVIYLAAYYPEAGLMAKEMSTLRVKARCLADAGAYDLGFINAAGKKAAAQCPVVGVPAAGEFPGSAAHVAAYRALFHREPGTWTPYTYDSVKLFAYAVGQAGSFDAARLTSVLNTVREWPGWTGTVSIDASTGNRDPATIVVLVANGPHAFRVDSGWQKAVHARSG